MDNKNKEKDKKLIMHDILTVIIVVIITLLFSRYVIGLTSVVGNSMNDTYHNGDLLLTKKYTKNCKRFDVVDFKTKNNETFIKRIIGLPGETIRIDTNGNIYINGEILEENYGKEKIRNPGNAINEIKLGENEYFVLGDNRNNSEDSRFDDVGVINKKDIVGIIMFHSKK